MLHQIKQYPEKMILKKYFKYYLKFLNQDSNLNNPDLQRTS